MNVDAAAAYAERHALEALLVQRDGEVLYERYGAGFDRATPHALYSGTKSFWGVAAVAAEADGLLSLDETVGATFAQWAIGRRSDVTLRELLTLTSGIGFGGLGNAVPSYDKALAVELTHDPGTRFTYGGIPLQIFGAVLAHKLGGTRTPHDYLAERVFAPLGLRVSSWRRLADGTQTLPTGAFLAAQEWAKFGRLVVEGGSFGGVRVVAESALARCFTATPANPRYGLTWWLCPLSNVPDVVYASGAGGQALYVIPSERAVIVKFGKKASYAHEAFLRRLLL